MDTVLTKLSPRKDGGRVWIEDSYSRLTRNGFAAGSNITVNDRPGSGLILRRTEQLSRNSVSSRKGAPIIDIDGIWVLRRFEGSDFLRVRLSFNSAIIVPRVLTASVARAGEVAQIRGNILLVAGTQFAINTPKPARIPFSISELSIDVSAANLLYAMETIINNRPANVSVTGSESPIASAYLTDAGYTPNGEGRFSL